MLELKLKGIKVKCYESLFEMPNDKYQQFQRALLLDLHGGTTMADVQEKYAKIQAFITKDLKSEAIEEINNILLTMHLTINGIDTKANAFYWLINSIDGNVVGASDNLEQAATLEVLNDAGIAQSQIIDVIENFKKKLLTR